jgi:outer membrane protein assembly factor BamA
VEPGDGGSFLVENLQRERQIHAIASGILAYPFRRSMRVEVRAGIHTAYYHRTTRSRTFSMTDGRLMDEFKNSDASAPAPLHLFESSAALVSDTALSGPVSALLGSRFRLELTSARGDANYLQWLADYRKYWMLPRRPITIAMRGLHVGRYGAGAEDARLLPFSLRRNAYMRGAEYDATMEGSKMLVAQLEIRFPVFGLFAKRLTWGPVPLEGFAFGDGGAVWSADQLPSWLGGHRRPFASAGAGARIRLGGFVLEAAAAHKFDPVRGGWTLAINARPPF